VVGEWDSTWAVSDRDILACFGEVACHVRIRHSGQRNKDMVLAWTLLEEDRH
jgi:hypothetical protein